MALALLESQKALPACLPNPPVGCVLVRNEQIVSRGYTRAPGEYHAEADALAKIVEPMTGLTAYVTLEPCSFHGRTPSCADALIKHGIEKVVVALVDPDPRNNGQGLKKLSRAGVEVVQGVCADKVDEFLETYLHQANSELKSHDSSQE